jgi:hypothetical protein
MKLMTLCALQMIKHTLSGKREREEGLSASQKIDEKRKVKRGEQATGKKNVAWGGVAGISLFFRETRQIY